MRICRIKFISKTTVLMQRRPTLYWNRAYPIVKDGTWQIWLILHIEESCSNQKRQHLVFWWRYTHVGCEAGQEDNKVLKLVILIPVYQFCSLVSASNLRLCHSHFLSRNDQSQSPNQIYQDIIVLMHHLGIAWPAIMSPIAQLCNIEYSKTSMKYCQFCCCIFQMEKRPVVLKFTGCN